MKYHSTRNASLRRTASQAILQGISEEGGLLVPQEIPQVDLASLQGLDYCALAAKLLGLYLTDYSADFLLRAARQAYGPQRFGGAAAKTVKLEQGLYSLELWHGPTSAFKDYALQLMPLLLVEAKRINRDDGRTAILVATSGDTGKAALEGYKDLPGVEIAVFYPDHGTSEIQRLQMATQEGANVHVFAVGGNFDDAQTGVKKIFTDKAVAEHLLEHNMQFSSANSINWGRLAPQIVYYVSAYCDLLNRGESLENGFNVTVPTGNFGNILAAYYAKKMGVPINKLICASNSNNVLTDFIKTGKYDRNRDFYTTVSPSMDILISSNLERMLFELSGCDDKAVAEMQNELKNSGAFCVSDDMEKKITELFWGGCCSDAQTLETIGNTYKEYGYLCDTHTAVAVNVYGQYVKATGDNRPVVIASTASPYKFADSVLSALTDKKAESDFDKVRQLSRLTSTEIPEPIKALENAEIRFNDVCEKDEMLTAVYSALKI